MQDCVSRRMQPPSSSAPHGRVTHVRPASGSRVICRSLDMCNGQRLIRETGTTPSVDACRAARIRSPRRAMHAMVNIARGLSACDACRAGQLGRSSGKHRSRACRRPTSERRARSGRASGSRRGSWCWRARGTSGSDHAALALVGRLLSAALVYAADPAEGAAMQAAHPDQAPDADPGRCARGRARRKRRGPVKGPRRRRGLLAAGQTRGANLMWSTGSAMHRPER